MKMFSGKMFSGRVARTAMMLALFGSGAAGLLAAAPAMAADKLVVGKSTPTGMSWLPLDIGIDMGIFQKEGLDIEPVGFAGAAKMHQAMAAGGADIGLGGGTDLGFIAKGAPEVGILDMADELRDLAVIVWDGSGINSLDDLKGGKLGVSSPGGLTDYLALELAIVKKWGPKGTIPVYLGGAWQGYVAALQTHQIDAAITGPELGLQLQLEKKGHILASAADYIPPIIAHGMYATKSVTQDRPDVVRRFVKGWLETIAFMNSNEDESLKLAIKSLGLDAGVAKQEYDYALPSFSKTGIWNKTGVDGVAQALVDTKFMETKADLTPYYTDKFLPAK